MLCYDGDIEVYFKLYIYLLLYAHDTVILVESQEQLQTALNLMFLYCQAWKLAEYQVSMIRKYHNHKLQPNQWYLEEEPHNNNETPGRQSKLS